MLKESTWYVQSDCYGLSLKLILQLKSMKRKNILVITEKRRVPVKRSFQVLVGDVKVIVGVLPTGECIGATCMLAQVLAVFILLWVLFCSEEQHVLTKVREARDIPWVR